MLSFSHVAYFSNNLAEHRIPIFMRSEKRSGQLTKFMKRKSAGTELLEESCVRASRLLFRRTVVLDTKATFWRHRWSPAVLASRVCQARPSPCPPLETPSPKVRRGGGHLQEAKNPTRFLFSFNRIDVEIPQIEAPDASRGPLSGFARTRI